jgi:hypothetical protein
MMRTHLFVAVLVTTVACGDNSKQCGPGTVDVDGVCEPMQCGPGTVVDAMSGQCVPDGSMICTDGTVFENGQCVIDPDSCQDGTVLVNGKCVDPGVVTADVSEAPEPNGLGALGEDSEAPAGTITVPAVGAPGVVVHGTINPFQDIDGDGQPDPDVDSYVLAVPGPTLLDLTADGVHGLAAGFATFAIVSDTNPLVDWERLGINLVGDTSKRQVYLPAAGTYVLSIGDTRSFFLLAGAAGGPNADYYVTIKQLAIPAPTPLVLTNNAVVQTGTITDNVLFFSAAMGTGFNRVTLDMPQPQAVASELVITNGTLRRIVDETTNLFDDPVPASLVAGGFNTTDTTVIVVDHIYNYALAPAAYRLTVTRSDASPLSRTGGTVSQMETTFFSTDLSQFNVFSYDVAAANEIDGIDIAWNHPVDGILTDRDLNIVGQFTFDPFVGFQGDTFASYKGLVRHARAGRYYFVVYDPNNGGNATLSATSTITAIPAAAVTLGTPKMATTNAFQSVPFTFNTTTSDWDQLDASGTGTGTLTASFFNPQVAFGTLDAVQVDQTNSGGPSNATFTPDAVELFGYTFPESGQVHGKIMIRQQTKNFLVRVRPQTASAGQPFTLAFSPRTALRDLMTVAGGASAMANGEALDTTTPERFYLVRSTTANKLALTVDPVTPTLDTQIQFVDDDENPIGAPVTSGGPGSPDVAQGRFTTTYLAWKVTGAPLAATPSTFDLTAAVTLPPAYAVTPTTTAFADACIGGTMQPLVATTTFAATDEGLTAPIAAPAGFTLFGDPTTTFRVASNGWLAFGTITGSAAANQQMPFNIAPNGMIAAYWDDLDAAVVCTKPVGSKLVVQWTAHVFNAPASAVVQVQAILDPTDDSIEFVWSSAQKADGASATVGIEDIAGLAGKQLSFNMAGSVAPSTATKLTPM